MMALSSYLSLSLHFSSFGPACTVRRGMLDAAYSIELIMLKINIVYFAYFQEIIKKNRCVFISKPFFIRKHCFRVLQQLALLINLDMTNINPKNIFVLSALDKLISQHKANPALFSAIFEQKQTILQLLQTGKIDASKYKKIVATAYKQQSGLIKACAQEDVQKLANPKDPKAIDQWFRLMIQNTGANYEKQQKLYKHYQTQLQPQPVVPQKPSQTLPKVQKPKEVEQKGKQAGPNVQDIVSFKYLDSAMDIEDKLQNYKKLYDRKKKLWDYVVKKELTAEKYKFTLETYCNKLKGSEIASDYRFELDGIEDFHDGNVVEWFKQIIEQTKDNLETQTDKLNSLSKGSQPKKVQRNSLKRAESSARKTLVDQKNKTSGSSFNISEINCFKVFDECLEQQSQNKNNYKEILEKKKKVLQLVKKGGLNAEKYRALLLKCISQVRNQEIKQSMEFQLSQIADFHNNNLNQWFKDVISNAQLSLQQQQEGMKLLEQGKKIKKKEESDQEIDMKFLNDDEDFQMPNDDDQLVDLDIKPQVQKPKPKKQVTASTKKKQSMSESPKANQKNNEFSEFFSLKALDEFMSENQSNPDIFCKCFQRKQAIFGMMQRGQINAEKYKTLQQKSFKSTDNAKLKQCIEMDLFDLKDMCEGNVNQWFQNLINDTGFNYEEQQEKYEKMKGKGGAPGSQITSHSQKVQQLKQKPNIAEVVCFTALSKLFEFTIKTSDIVYYKQLCNKREKLIQLVSQGRLIPNKYKDINKAAAAKTENSFLKNVINEQLTNLSSKYQNNQQTWFQSLKKGLLQPPPQLKLPENPMMKKVNALPIEQKIQYIAKRMAPYQSLIVYYNNNKLNINDNPYIVDYQKKNKKQIFQGISLLKKDKDFDIFNLVEQLFPTINAEVFYSGKLPALKKQAQSYIPLFVQEIAALKEYTTKIKKATNPQNLQNTAKQIAKCQQNITSLKSWPGKQLVPFPIVTQQKVQRYNLDLNTHLQQNQVQINITYVDGMRGQTYLRIFVGAEQNERFWVKIKNGPQSSAKTIIKLPPKQMADLMKGDKPLIIVRFFQKTFFGNWKLMEECFLTGCFIRNNIVEQKTNANDIKINYEMRVYKPTKPLITQIPHTSLKLLPPFEPDSSVIKQLVKQCVSYVKE